MKTHDGDELRPEAIAAAKRAGVTMATCERISLAVSVVRSHATISKVRASTRIPRAVKAWRVWLEAQKVWARAQRVLGDDCPIRSAEDIFTSATSKVR